MFVPKWFSVGISEIWINTVFQSIWINSENLNSEIIDKELYILPILKQLNAKFAVLRKLEKGKILYKTSMAFIILNISKKLLYKKINISGIPSYFFDTLI